jgi:hypothetical protein
MNAKSKWLKRYLVTFGLLNIFVISFTIPIFLGGLLLWQPRNLPVEMMLSSIYLVMGVVMIAAAKNPMTHKSLVDFLVLANPAHALVMLLFAQNIWHLVDVFTIGLLGGFPLLFYPWEMRYFMRD